MFVGERWGSSSYTEFPIKQDDEEIPPVRCKNCNERGESGKLEIGKRKTERKKKYKMRQTKDYAYYIEYNVKIPSLLKDPLQRLMRQICAWIVDLWGPAKRPHPT